MGVGGRSGGGEPRDIGTHGTGLEPVEQESRDVLNNVFRKGMGGGVIKRVMMPVKGAKGPRS